jgi:hypothetical protein
VEKEKGDSAGATSHLKKIGTWVLNTAEKIGVGLAEPSARWRGTRRGAKWRGFRWCRLAAARSPSPLVDHSELTAALTRRRPAQAVTAAQPPPRGLPESPSRRLATSIAMTGNRIWSPIPCTPAGGTDTCAASAAWSSHKDAREPGVRVSPPAKPETGRHRESCRSRVTPEMAARQCHPFSHAGQPVPLADAIAGADAVHQGSRS